MKWSRGRAATTPRVTPLGLAMDLGSARLRLWSPNGLSVDVPGAAAGRTPLVSRGRIADVHAVSAVVEESLAALPIRQERTIAVATTPVLSDDAYRDDVRAVLQPLGVEAVVLIDGVKAAAFGAGVDVCEPLLVVDVGARLTEVALIAEGVVVQARRTEVGLGVARTVVDAVGEAILELLQGPCGSQVVEALDRGVLLIGGGALRPEITYKLGRRLGAVVRPAPAPHTAAVRGAAAALQATHRHPTSSPTSP